MFKVLNTSDRVEWKIMLATLAPEYRDVHYSWEYGCLFEKEFGDTAHLAVWQDGEAWAIQAFVERKDKSRADIATPYGYGGPVSNAWARLPEFMECFDRYKDEHGFKREFLTLHPLFCANQNQFFHARKFKETVHIDLTQPAWLRKGHKSAVKSAQRQGVQCDEIIPTHDNIELFRQMYMQTMARNNAEDRWYYSWDYFHDLLVILGDKAALFFAGQPDHPECGCIILHDLPAGAPMVYYQYAGSFGRWPRSGMMHLMVATVAEWARARGAKLMQLGGGVTPEHDDSLLRFKSGFSKLRAPFYVVNR